MTVTDSSDTLLERFGPKAVKYSLVSAVGVVVTQIVLLTCHSVLGWPAGLSNVVAVTVACIPSYTLNRRWVWGKRGRNHLLREVLPFWSMTVAGLIISTVLVSLADEWWDSALAVSAANLAGFGVLWVLKFFVLDGVLFRIADDVEAADSMSTAA